VASVPGGPGRRAFVVLSTDEYSAMTLGAGGREAVAFVWIRLTPADAIEMLLTGYRMAGVVQQPAPPTP